MGFPGAAKWKGVPCPGKGGADAPAALIRALTWQILGPRQCSKAKCPSPCRLGPIGLPSHDYRNGLLLLSGGAVSRGAQRYITGRVHTRGACGRDAIPCPPRPWAASQIDSRLTRRDQTQGGAVASGNKTEQAQQGQVSVSHLHPRAVRLVLASREEAGAAASIGVCRAEVVPSPHGMSVASALSWRRNVRCAVSVTRPRIVSYIAAQAAVGLPHRQPSASQIGCPHYPAG